MKNLLLKKVIVDSIKQYYKGHPFVIFYNYFGMDSEETFQLKKKLKNNGGVWKVCKNSLIKKAFPIITTLKDNNALVLCSNQENKQYDVLNILYNFAKKSAISRRIQGGLENNIIFSSETLENWANLPNIKILINQTCSCLVFPISKLIFILQKKIDNDKK